VVTGKGRWWRCCLVEREVDIALDSHGRDLGIRSRWTRGFLKTEKICASVAKVSEKILACMGPEVGIGLYRLW